MNIVVVLHPVRAPASFTVNRKAQKIFTQRDEYIINPADKNALEAALRLDARVTVVALGEAPADEVLRLARAMGATGALRVGDAALARADASARVTVLQRLIAHIGGADLILLGADVLDSDLAQIGPRLAQALNWSLVSEAHQLSVSDHTPSAEGGRFTALVPHQNAFHKVETDLPVVVSVARDSNQPRYAHGREILNTFKAKEAVEVLTLADLQLSESDVAPLVEIRGESFPPERELGRLLDGSLDDAAHQIVNVIRKV